MSRVNIEVTPNNQSSTISYRNGQPVIQFLIGEQQRFLLGNSVRLCGDISFFTADATATLPASKVRIDERLGIWGAIDQLVIRSQKTQQVMEHLKSYPRFMQSYLQNTTSDDDANTHLNVMSLGTNNWTNSWEQVCQGDNNNVNSFCVPLPCGVLNGQNPLPLSRDWGLGGIVIEVHLSPDASFLFEQDGTGTNISDAYYELKNVSLVAELSTPQPQELSKLMSIKNQTFEFNSFSSYYHVIDNQNAIININLGLKRVLSSFMNFVPSRWLNNRSFNSQSSVYPSLLAGTPAKVQQVIFTKGGMKYPLSYDVNTQDKQTPDSDTPPLCDPQLFRLFNDCFRKYSQGSGRIQTSPHNRSFGLSSFLPVAVNQVREGGFSYGIGILYDAYDNGIDFSNMSWGVNMNLDLTDINSPNSCFIFVHAKNTMVFNESGLQIIN